jgi:hypothetical protein
MMRGLGLADRQQRKCGLVCAPTWGQVKSGCERDDAENRLTLLRHRAVTDLSNGLTFNSPAAAQRLEYRDLVLNQQGIG